MKKDLLIEKEKEKEKGRRRGRERSPWFADWLKHSSKVKVIGTRLGAITITSKTTEDFRREKEGR